VPEIKVKCLIITTMYTTKILNLQLFDGRVPAAGVVVADYTVAQ
jgi:hypothetical protein